MVEKEPKPITFSLDPKSGVPFYRQIIQQVEMARIDGRLTSGDQLPTVRGLAVELRINPNTVARAYSELEIRGIVTTQQGTGTFLSDKRIEPDEVDRERILNELTTQFAARVRSSGFTLREAIDLLEEAAHDE